MTAAATILKHQLVVGEAKPDADSLDREAGLPRRSALCCAYTPKIRAWKGRVRSPSALRKYWESLSAPWRASIGACVVGTQRLTRRIVSVEVDLEDIEGAREVEEEEEVMVDQAVASLHERVHEERSF